MDLNQAIQERFGLPTEVAKTVVANSTLTVGVKQLGKLTI
jgi:hypothetical protein